MTEATNETALRLEDFSITLPDGRALVANAQLNVRRGEFVLLVGPSGSGKSTLLRLIAGLGHALDCPLEVSGQLTVEGEAPGHGAAARVGLVFQNHALFDELSAVSNVRFAFDHRPNGEAARHEPEALLRDLNINPSARPATLSGGERQRVAVARTLAMDPPILLFDEPTTGLDPGRARSVAELIARTHRMSEKTVVIVTHDIEPFLAYEPRIILIDDDEGKLVETNAKQAHQFLNEKAPPVLERPARRPDFLDSRRWNRLPWLEAPGEFVLMLGLAFRAIFSGWGRARWKLRYLWHYMRIVLVGSTSIYVAIAGAMLGFVFVSFSFKQIPYSDVTLPLFTEEFLAATGYSTLRVIVPLLIAVLVAGKCGASIAADVGSRRYAHQFDAMKNCGADPEHYLFGNIVLALMVGVPILTAVAYVTNCYASMIAYLMTSGEGTIAFFHRNYFATVWPAGDVLPKGTGWLALKMTGSGLVIAGIAYAIGSRPKSSTVDVSRDVGLTIFWGSLAVLLLHALFSYIEF